MSLEHSDLPRETTSSHDLTKPDAPKLPWEPPALSELIGEETDGKSHIYQSEVTVFTSHYRPS